MSRPPPLYETGRHAAARLALPIGLSLVLIGLAIAVVAWWP